MPTTNRDDAGPPRIDVPQGATQQPFWLKATAGSNVEFVPASRKGLQNIVMTIAVALTALTALVRISRR
jgi:hypothetical protein